jgi:hypothetical protein
MTNRNGEKMYPFEKVDRYIHLMNFQLEHFKQTRSIEWRMNYALWALIAAAGYFMFGEIYLESCCSFGIYTLIALAIIVVHCRWKYCIQSSLDKDSVLYYQFRKRAIHIIGEDPHDENDKDIYEKLPKPHEGTNWKWIIIEVGVTCILLVIAGLLLSLPPKYKNDSHEKVIKVEFYESRTAD